MIHFENPVEHVLKDKGPYGLSLKEIEYLLGVDRRRIMHHIFQSKNIDRTDPLLHGSLKKKIRVFKFKDQVQVPSQDLSPD